MSRTYKATGINLKSMPLGESDRLLTVLTREFGLIRVVAPGARKHHSRLGGRSEIFVVNELLIAKGRSLDKITQAETVNCYPRLSQDLAKLAAGQYLAEMVLCHALSEQPQEELFSLLNGHLERLEQLPKQVSQPSFIVLAHLAHAVFHVLALAGVAPQVHHCCLSEEPLTPDFIAPQWRVGFSLGVGGTISLAAFERWQAQKHLSNSERIKVSSSLYTSQEVLTSAANKNGINSKSIVPKKADNQSRAIPGMETVVHQQPKIAIDTQLSATELSLFQQLSKPKLPEIQNSAFPLFFLDPSWLSVERILRRYTQYQFGRQICSAALIDTYFASLPTSS